MEDVPDATSDGLSNGPISQSYQPLAGTFSFGPIGSKSEDTEIDEDMPADTVMARPCQPFMGVSRSAASSSSADADMVDVSGVNSLDIFAAQSSYVPVDLLLNIGLTLQVKMLKWTL